MKNRAVLVLFLLAIIIDLVVYNRAYIPAKIISFPPTMFFIYPIRDINILDKIYFLGYAIDYSLIVLCVSILAKDIFILNLVASAWFGLCLNNVYDEITDNNLVPYNEEYFFLFLSVIIVIYKIHVHAHPEHKAGTLFYRLRDFLLLKMFAWLSR